MKQLPKHKKQALLVLAVTLTAAVVVYCVGFSIRDTPQALQAAAENAFTDHEGKKVAAGAEVVEVVRVGREMALLCQRGEQQGDVVLHQGILGGWRQVGGSWYHTGNWAETVELRSGKTGQSLLYGFHCPPQATRYQVTRFFGDENDILAQGAVQSGRVVELLPLEGMLHIWLYDASGQEVRRPDDSNVFGGGRTEVTGVYILIESILAIGGLKTWFLWRKKLGEAA